MPSTAYSAVWAAFLIIRLYRAMVTALTSSVSSVRSLFSSLAIFTEIPSLSFFDPSADCDENKNMTASQSTIIKNRNILLFLQVVFRKSISLLPEIINNISQYLTVVF